MKELLTKLSEELTRQAYKDSENAAELDKFGSRVLANDNRFAAKLKHEIAGTITSVVMDADQDVKPCRKYDRLKAVIETAVRNLREGYNMDYVLDQLESVLKDDA